MVRLPAGASVIIRRAIRFRLPGRATAPWLPVRIPFGLPLTLSIRPRKRAAEMASLQQCDSMNDSEWEEISLMWWWGSGAHLCPWQQGWRRWWGSALVERQSLSIRMSPLYISRNPIFSCNRLQIFENKSWEVNSKVYRLTFNILHSSNPSSICYSPNITCWNPFS